MRKLTSLLQFLGGFNMLTGVAIAACTLRHQLRAPIDLDAGPYLIMASVAIGVTLAGVSLNRLAAWYTDYTTVRWTLARRAANGNRPRLMRVKLYE